MEKNKTKIIIGIVSLIVIAITIFCIIKFNKSENNENISKIVITRYDENSNIIKTMEVTNKKDVNEINKICNNTSLEQNDDTKYLGIRKDIKIDLGNGTSYVIQLDLAEYCYYEDLNSNAKLVIKMPNGLLDKANGILSDNK